MKNWRKIARARMDELGWTHEDLARQMGTTTLGTVRNWFSGRTAPNVELARDLCDALGLSLNETFANRLDGVDGAVDDIAPGGEGR